LRNDIDEIQIEYIKSDTLNINSKNILAPEGQSLKIKYQ